MPTIALAQTPISRKCWKLAFCASAISGTFPNHTLIIIRDRLPDRTHPVGPICHDTSRCLCRDNRHAQRPMSPHLNRAVCSDRAYNNVILRSGAGLSWIPQTHCHTSIVSPEIWHGG